MYDAIKLAPQLAAGFTVEYSEDMSAHQGELFVFELDFKYVGLELDLLLFFRFLEFC